MKIIIVGNSDFAILLKDYIESEKKYQILAFTVEKKFIKEDNLCGYPVIALEQIRDIYPPSEVKLLLAIGYSQMNAVKKRLFSSYLKYGYEFINYIHPKAILPDDVQIGVGNIILEGVIIERHCCLGDGNLFFAGSVIGHDNLIGNFNTFSIGVVTAGNVTVEDCCFFGVHSSVRDSVQIESSVLVGAAAYVGCNMKDSQVIKPVRSMVLQDRLSKDFL